MSDFAALAPEINSALMYAGPGSGPLLACAAVWDALAAQLETFGAEYSATISALQGQSWSGAASTAMAAAAAPYVAWVTTTAWQAGEAASQARAAAAAYEAAFAATVPPAVVIANRTLLATLVATNFLGQNTPAIAATEAVYVEMWAQDAAAMYGYAMSASAAATLTPLSQPPQTTNPGGLSGQAAGVTQAVNTSLGHQTTLSQLMSAVPQQLQTLASGGFTNAAATPTSTPFFTALRDLHTLLRSTELSFIVPKTVFQGGSFAIALQQSGAQASALPATPAPAAGAAAAAQSSAPTGFGESVLASVGRATPEGGLSVPQGWTTAAPGAVPAAERAVVAEPARALPPWADPTNPSVGTPSIGQFPNGARRSDSNAVFRMRDRRYRMPRPAPGG